MRFHVIVILGDRSLIKIVERKLKYKKETFTLNLLINDRLSMYALKEELYQMTLDVDNLGVNFLGVDLLNADNLGVYFLGVDLLGVNLF